MYRILLLSEATLADHDAARIAELHGVDDVTAQATVAPILSLGLRAAKNLGFVSPWVGIDARFRLQRLQLSDVAASDISGSLTIGVRFIDWSGK